MRSSTVSIYAEMLKLALESDEHADSSVPALVNEALARRVDLECGGDAASRLARALAYDVILVRLCEQVGVPHDLTGESAGPSARRQAERKLAVRLPELGSGLRQG